MEASHGAVAGTARIISSSGGVGIMEIGPICAVLWREGVTAPRFEKQRAALAEVVDKHPGQAAFLCIIEPTAHPPDDKLRRASTDMVLGHGDRLKCVAGVIEGTGFRAAVTRSALSTITMFMANRKGRISVFSEITGALRWMVQSAKIDVGPRAASEIERLRGMLPPAEGSYGKPSN